MPDDRKHAWRDRLARAGVHRPDDDLDYIIARVSEDEIETIVARREAREPFERIFGEATFLGRSYQLPRGVFKPGFETETTVEHAVAMWEGRGRAPRILDLGTGTGCLLISLLHLIPGATGVGVDVSEDILKVARGNAERYGVAARAAFQVSDWMKDVVGPFDLVISNPPRIPTAAISLLVPEVSVYDPAATLDGGRDGLGFYRRTASEFRSVMAPDAIGVLQVGKIVAAGAEAIFHRAGYHDVHVQPDQKMAVNCVCFTNAPARLPWRRFWPF